MASSIKKDQNRQRELAYIRQVKQTMKPKSDEERQREIAAEQAQHVQTTGEKVTNFLYYYKWRILLGIAVLIAGVFLLVNLIQKPKYDIKILTLYSSSEVNMEQLAGALNEYVVDLDGNGQSSAEIIGVSLGNSSDTTSRPKMISYINDANTMIYLVDEGIYEELVGQEPDMFMDLSELFPGNPNVDGQRYFLKGTVLEETIGAKNIPEELAFVIRTENHAGSHPENYDHAVELLTNVVNGVKTTDES
ncbi:MAG: hypothetical protein DBY25_05575 [Clostridiales bacterium]|nr:MAG: hypothetical protein DBY25_05575 [Clostridiales bacterium]